MAFERHGPWWRKRDEDKHFSHLRAKVHHLRISYSPYSSCICFFIFAWIRLNKIAKDKTSSVCIFARVGVQWHTNVPTNLLTPCARLCNSKHIQKCSRVPKSPPIDGSSGYHSKGRESHQIFNTQQTYQPLTAECGLDHLPESEHIFTDTNKLGSILPRYTALSASIWMLN